MRPQPQTQWHPPAQCPPQPLRTLSNVGASCTSVIGCSFSHSSKSGIEASTRSASSDARNPTDLSAAYTTSSRERGRGRKRGSSGLVSNSLQQRQLRPVADPAGCANPAGRQPSGSLRRIDHVTGLGTQAMSLRIGRGTPALAPVPATARRQAREASGETACNASGGAELRSRITACSQSRSRVTAHGVEGPSGFWQCKQTRPQWRVGKAGVNATPGSAGSGGAVADRDGTGNDGPRSNGAAAGSPSAATTQGSAGARGDTNGSAQKAKEEEEEEEDEEYSYIFPDPSWVPAASEPDTPRAQNGSATSPACPPSPLPAGPQGLLPGLLPFPSLGGMWSSITGAAQGLLSTVPPEGFILLVACSVGLATGASVVAFNDGVHAIRDAVWQGVPPEEGSAWIREQPLGSTALLLLLVPTSGGLAVGILNSLRAGLTDPPSSSNLYEPSALSSLASQWRAVARPFLKALAAVVTLGTGNSLGPEGPSVEIGASVAKGASSILQSSRERTIALVAAGSAAGIASGFNAAVSGCFFALEYVLRGSSAPQQGSPASLTTAMILLSAVLAAVVSQAGLGSDPAVRVPLYEFRSPAELPLYLLLGVLCGGVSVALSRSATYFEGQFQTLQAQGRLLPELSPAVGGLAVGLLALAYPEVLYWGFVNINDVLSVRPLQPGPSAALLLQLVGAKVLASAFCKGAGLVGGFYAPSLFIGASLGSAYGRLASDALLFLDPDYNLTWIQVASPPAYAMVGMAAVLAGVCQVPLTAVLLLFELTQDYRIILPLMAAVGISSWLASPRKPAPPATLPPTTAAGPLASPPLPSSAAAPAAAAPPLAASSQLLAAQPAPQPAASTSSAASASESKSAGSARNGAAAALKRGAAAGSVAGATSVTLDAGAQALRPPMATPSFPTSPPVPTQALGPAPMGREAIEVTVGDPDVEWEVRDGILMEEEVLAQIPVSAAMRTAFAGVGRDATVGDALGRMVHHRQWSCMVVGEGSRLLGMLTLSQVQEAIEKEQDNLQARAKSLGTSKKALVPSATPQPLAIAAEDVLATDVAQLPAISICTPVGKEGDSGAPARGARGRLEVTFPNSSLKEAQGRMTARGLRQLPVVLRRFTNSPAKAPAGAASAVAGAGGGTGAGAGGEGRGQTLLILGVLDSDDISLACRTEVTKRLLSSQQKAA